MNLGDTFSRLQYRIASNHTSRSNGLHFLEKDYPVEKIACPRSPVEYNGERRTIISIGKLASLSWLVHSFWILGS